MLLNHCCSNLTLSSVSSSLSSHQRSHHGGWSWGLLCYFCLCFPVVKLKINSPCLSVVVCRCPGVDELRGLSSVLNSSVRSRDQAAVTCTDEDGPWRYVRLDCYHGNSHIFTLCLLCVCCWQQPWWRFWSLLVWRLMGWVVKTLVLPSAPQGLLQGSRSWVKTLTGSWPPSNPGLRSSRGWTCWTMPSGSAKRMYHDGELNTYTHTHTCDALWVACC